MFRDEAIQLWTQLLDAPDLDFIFQMLHKVIDVEFLPISSVLILLEYGFDQLSQGSLFPGGFELRQGDLLAFASADFLSVAFGVCGTWVHGGRNGYQLLLWL